MRETKEKPAWKQERVGAALADMETMLGDNKWLCGDEMTLADICTVCEVSSFSVRTIKLVYFYLRVKG